MQFGSRPLFENVSVKFSPGARYGLIGANGCGKSTFMKILGGDLKPTAGVVSLETNARIGKLRQDQFAFEKFSVIDTVIMGHQELWQVKAERDRIYNLPERAEERRVGKECRSRGSPGREKKKTILLLGAGRRIVVGAAAT